MLLVAPLQHAVPFAQHCLKQQVFADYDPHDVVCVSQGASAHVRFQSYTASEGTDGHGQLSTYILGFFPLLSA